MPEKLLKITYHGAPAGATKKLNAYLRMPSNTLAILRREIEMYLFQERQLPQGEIRTYWIDADSDEIEIVNQNDYEIFMAKCENNMHLQIAAAGIEKADGKQEAAAAAPTEDDPTNFIIHDGVECDSCGAVPMVGFRYKCVQCPNFDLCQKCETAHKHPEHLMVRMPTNNGPSVVDAWLSGPGSSSHHHRRSGRRFRAHCPFAETAGAATGTATATGAAPTASAGAAAGDLHKDPRRDRRHSRRHGGVLSQFVEMMMHLPESNGTATPAAEATSQEATEKKQTSSKKVEPTVLAKKAEEVQSVDKSAKSKDLPIKLPIVEEPVVAPNVQEPIAASNVEEPVAAPRVKEQPKAQATSTASSTPTTPVISLENLAQMVNPEYMRAGIEILNNFSEMFAKMIDPSEAAAFGCADTSIASNTSTASQKSEADTETPQKPSKQTTAATSAAESVEALDLNSLPVKSAASLPAAPAVAADPEPEAITDLTTYAEPEPEQRERSESLDQDQDWQMIDNNAKPISHVSSSDALINLNTTNSKDAAVSPVRDFAQLGELLRQHVNDEHRVHTSAQTQTSQVATVSTSTSTNSVATNSTSTSTTASPPAPEEKRFVPVYHTDERINAAVHAMMAMGFSNEGAWLTQLLESVEGNIPAALDIMHTSQSGRN